MPNRKLYHLYPSSNPSKKWDVYVDNPATHRIKKVSFGAAGYEDYTQHKDKVRRESYIRRHGHDRLTTITAPGAWSRFVLWGDSTSIKVNLQSMLRRFRIRGQA